MNGLFILVVVAFVLASAGLAGMLVYGITRNAKDIENLKEYLRERRNDDDENTTDVLP